MTCYRLCVLSALFISCQANRFKVIVKTGNRNSAGTDANVYLTLYGESGTCGPNYLDTPKNDFERNSRDEFIVTCYSLKGTLEKIRIGHDNTGYKPGWYLIEVVIEDIELRQFYTFACNKWLATNTGDGAISRVLTPYTYKVRVYTGSRSSSGTDAKVRITLFGSLGDCGPVHLDDADDNFEIGKVDEFKLMCPSLGNLKKVHIAHDNSGRKPGWYLDKIEVSDLVLGSVFTFPCNKWLARNTGDHAIWRDLTPVEP